MSVRADILSVALAAGLAVSAGAAGAGSLNTISDPSYTLEAPTQSASPWVGGYAGVQLQYFHVIDGAVNRDGNGVMGGAHVGYRGEGGPYIFGVEFEANAVPIQLQSGGTIDFFVAGKGKYAVPIGRLLLGATVGVSVYGTSFGTASGFVYGGSLEYLATDKVSVGLEYLGHNITSYGNPPNPTVPGPTAIAGSVSFRASYKF